MAQDIHMKGRSIFGVAPGTAPGAVVNTGQAAPAILQFGTSVTPGAAGQTRYLAPGFQAGVYTDPCPLLIPYGSCIFRLHVVCTVGTTGGNLQVIVTKDGLDTTLTCTLAAGDLRAVDIDVTHKVECVGTSDGPPPVLANGIGVKIVTGAGTTVGATNLMVTMSVTVAAPE